MSSASLEQVLWAQQRFCFGQGALACQCLHWLVKTYLEMGTYYFLVRSFACFESKEHKSDRCLQKGYNDNARVNGIARRSSNPESVPGPTITGVIDNRETDATSSLSGYVIQDGCIPEAFKPIIHPMLLLQTLKTRAFSLVWNTRDGRGKFLASLRSVLFGPYAIGGAVQRTSTYLVMSHDSNEMTLTLKDNQICLSAPKEGQSKHFQRIKGMFHELFARTGAQMGFTYFYGKTKSSQTAWHLANSNLRTPPRGGHCASPGRRQHEQ